MIVSNFVVNQRTDGSFQGIEAIAAKVLGANVDIKEVQNIDWRLSVIHSKDANAFVLPVSTHVCKLNKLRTVTCHLIPYNFNPLRFKPIKFSSHHNFNPLQLHSV